MFFNSLGQRMVVTELEFMEKKKDLIMLSSIFLRM